MMANAGHAMVAPGTASYALHGSQTQHAMWVAICLEAMAMDQPTRNGQAAAGRVGACTRLV